MSQYEYKVVPAPSKGVRAKGVTGTQARFAHALTTLMNEMARDGWEYLRADTLPCEERQGLTGKSTRFQNMLVFRRALVEEHPAAETPAPLDTRMPPLRVPHPETPDEIAAAAAASLVARPDPGAAPALGPAQPQDGAPRPPRDVAAE